MNIMECGFLAHLETHHSANNMYPRPRSKPSSRPWMKFILHMMEYLYCIVSPTSTALMDPFFIDGLLLHNI